MIGYTSFVFHIGRHKVYKKKNIANRWRVSYDQQV